MKSNFVSTCIVYIRYINKYKFIDISLGDIDRRVRLDSINPFIDILTIVKPLKN